jgi:hypothetical protein
VKNVNPDRARLLVIRTSNFIDELMNFRSAMLAIVFCHVKELGDFTTYVIAMFRIGVCWVYVDVA